MALAGPPRSYENGALSTGFSHQSSRAAERDQEGLSGGAGRALGRGRGSAGSKASDEAGVGAGGKETCSPIQERLQVDLPLRLREARKRRGFLADPAHSQRRAVLDG